MKPQNKKILEFAVILAGVAVVALVIYPSTLNPRKSQSNRPIRNCKSNLRDLSTALEMYATDWMGAYPENMSQLSPNYIKDFPNCPVVDRDTYSASYHSSYLRVSDILCPEHPEDSGQEPDECSLNRTALWVELAKGKEFPETLDDYSEALTHCPSEKILYQHNRSHPFYSMCCQGDQHIEDLGVSDYPRFDSTDGLRGRPSQQRG